MKKFFLVNEEKVYLEEVCPCNDEGQRLYKFERNDCLADPLTYDDVQNLFPNSGVKPIDFLNNQYVKGECDVLEFKSVDGDSFDMSMYIED